jgi:superfamily II DNA/RNA helicase
MREIDVKNAIIFCNRKKDVGIVHRSLQRHGFNVGALHGDMDQHQRTATLDAFRSGQIAFLAASDVAARGLDIPDVSHIFNYDVPIHPEDYVHRIGRTGRAGREGFAAMLVTPRDYKALKAIEKMLRHEIPWIDGAPSEDEQREALDARPNGNGRHRRSNRSGRGKHPSGSGAKPSHPAKHHAPHAQRSAPQSTHHGKERDRPHGDAPKHRHAGEHKPTHSHAAPAPQAKKSQAAPQPPAKQPAPQQPRGRQQGMGDHVPAFMMRPVRVT